MYAKKSLAVFMAFAMLFSLFQCIAVLADSAEAAVYASQEGGGDGTTATTPTTLSDATSRVADNGTVYVVGTIASENGSLAIGVAGKTINFIGVGGTAAGFSTASNFDLSGNLSFDELAFTRTATGDDGVPFNGGQVTFGKNVTVNGTLWVYPTADNCNPQVTVNGGTYARINGAGCNGSVGNVNSTVTVNAGTVDTIAVAHGWSKSGWSASVQWVGNHSFIINGGSVTRVVLGHTQGGLRTTKGTVKTVVNGGTVGTIMMNAVNKDKGSTGVRIAEINGGTVGTICAGEAPQSSSFSSVVILNNGIEPTTLTADNIDTIIRVAEGGYASAVVQDNVIMGYEITATGNKLIKINGSYAKPNENGYYTIGSGESTVTFEDFTAVNTVYASADGDGDGTTATTPTTLSDATARVADNGTVYVVGTIGSESENINIGMSGKTINFKGADANAGFISKSNFNLIGNASFDELAFTRSQTDDDGVPFNGGQITFGKNVTVNGTVWVYPTVDNCNPQITVNGGSYARINGAGYNNSVGNVNSTVTVNAGTVNTIAVAHGYVRVNNWSTNRQWVGNHSFIINGGDVTKIVLGHTQSGLRTTKGTVKTVVNGGTVGTIFMNAENMDKGSNGLRIAEINGGTVGTVKGFAVNGTKSFKSVLILNNGIEATTVDATYIDTVIRTDKGGYASAVVKDNVIKGYAITGNKRYVYIDGVAVQPNSDGLYTIAAGTHTVTFSDTYTSEDVRINTWVARAEQLISTEGISFLDRTAFDAALESLKYTNAYCVPSAIAKLKEAWNGMTYTVNGENVTAHLYDYGDTNGDGAIDIRDLVRAKKSLTVGGAAVAPYTLDFNNDGVDDATDLTTLRKNLLGVGNTAFGNTYYKLTQEKKLNVAYFGGSVTVGDGSTDKANKSWRALTTAWLEKCFPDAEITETNAAIGGTGSEFGVYRAVSDLKLDSTAARPDLVFIEFAINDVYDGLDYAKAKSNMETIVRTVYEYVPDADIMLLFTTDRTQATQEYDTLKAHKEIAEAYRLPYLAIGSMLYNDILTESGEDTPSDEAWSNYFKDSVHPVDNGYAKYAEYVTSYLGQALMKFAQVPEGSVNSYVARTPLTALTYSPYAANAKGATAPEGFTLDSDGYLAGSTVGSTLTFKFTGTDLKLWTWSTPTSGSIDITIDGIAAGSQDLYRNVANSRVIPIASGLAEAEHTVTLTLQATDKGSAMELRWFLISGSDNHSGITLISD